MIQHHTEWQRIIGKAIKGKKDLLGILWQPILLTSSCATLHGSDSEALKIQCLNKSSIKTTLSIL